jgi:hypothetical protein
MILLQPPSEDSIADGVYSEHKSRTIEFVKKGTNFDNLKMKLGGKIHVGFCHPFSSISSIPISSIAKTTLGHFVKFLDGMLLKSFNTFLTFVRPIPSIWPEHSSSAHH